MEKKNIVRRKSYAAIFKLEVVDFAKEKGNLRQPGNVMLERPAYGNGGKKKLQ
jgi:hypothetical protein